MTQPLSIILKPLHLGFNSNVGAPCPLILSDELHLRLLFYTESPRDPNWDGTTVHIRDTEDDTGIAMVSFDIYNAYYFGSPNDEALSGHRYHANGLEPYSQYEMVNSEWLLSQEKMNQVHPYHSTRDFAAYRHFLFTFHDSCFEILAKNMTFETLNCSLMEGISVAMKSLNK